MSRPLIGVATSHSTDVTRAGPLSSVSVPKEYCAAVDDAGGLPVLLPTTGGRFVRELIAAVHGLLLVGGEDVDARLYCEQRAPGTDEPNVARDQSELVLVREALRQGKPVLGVCRGAQLLNVCLGGSLHQVLASPSVAHWSSFSPCHEIALMPGTTLRDLYGAPDITVNSYHRQAVKDVAAALRVAAVAPDGVIEAIEAAGPMAAAIGVQWHPEQQIDENRCLFSWLVERARTDHRKPKIGAQHD